MMIQPAHRRGDIDPHLQRDRRGLAQIPEKAGVKFLTGDKSSWSHIPMIPTQSIGRTPRSSAPPPWSRGSVGHAGGANSRQPPPGSANAARRPESTDIARYPLILVDGLGRGAEQMADQVDPINPAPPVTTIMVVLSRVRSHAPVGYQRA